MNFLSEVGQATDSKINYFSSNMIADRIYIPEDVLHAASPLDSSVRLDVLAHIQRDEWLEVEDNQVSFPRADGHGHR